jgi:hypothetical protein
MNIIETVLFKVQVDNDVIVHFGHNSKIMFGSSGSGGGGECQRSPNFPRHNLIWNGPTHI